MLLLDERGEVAAANARAEALLDTGGDRLAGAPFALLLPERQRPAFRDAFDAGLRPGEAPQDLEISLARAGEPALIGVTFLPVHGRDRAVLLLLRDLTRERQRRDDAAALEADAHRAALHEDRKMAELGKLIAGVTHELRTPLTFVANNLVMIEARLRALAAQRPELEPSLKELIETSRIAVEGASRVNHIVHELRPLSRNRAHNAVPTDLAELAVTAVKTFRGSHGLRPAVSVDLQATHAVPIDRDDMLNVLLNLLRNAAEASGPDGAIEVRTRNAATPPEIRIVDHGPGVAPSMRETLFEPFRTTKRDGTGLGLFISRRTVEAHGGTLAYEETPGGGATFVIRLPKP